MRIRFAARPEEKPARPWEASRAVARVLAATGLDLSDARARLGFSRGHLLEIVVLSSAFGGASDERALDAANLLVPALIGVSVFDDWIGAIDVGASPRPSSLRVLADGARPANATLSLDEVRPAVEAAIRGVDATLPAAPYHAQDGTQARAEWTLLEAEPEPAPDYAAQDDLVLLATRLPEAMKCFLQGAPFSSRRFSKHGERFVYAKVDGTGQTTDERYALRLAMEEALDQALARPGLGGVVGAGLGLRYVYAVFSLLCLEEGVAAAVTALRALGVPRNSWLLSCDSDCAEDWVGVHPDTPRPFGVE